MAIDRVLYFSESEYQRRLAGVRKKMGERGLRVLITHTPESIYYLTGYQTPGYNKYQALVVPETKEPIILTRVPEESNIDAASWVQNRVTYLDVQDHMQVLYNALVDASVVQGPIGVDKDYWYLSVNEYGRLTKLLGAGTEVVDSSGLVEGLRVVKSEEEIKYIRQAAAVADKGMLVGIEALADGRTDHEVSADIHHAVVGAGGEYMGFPVFFASGPHSHRTHAVPVGRRLAKGDVVKIELSGCVKRYSAALERTAYLGKNPPELIRRMSDLSLASLNGIISSLKPGMTPDEITRKDAELYKRLGFAHTKLTGYSIGINFPPDWGEGDALSLQRGEHRVLEPGMVFHTPAIVRAPGAAFVGHSETTLVTSNGPEVLTNCPPRDLIIK